MGTVITIIHASWIMKKQKYLIKHEFAIMQQVELYEFVSSVHRSPLLDDTWVTAVKFLQTFEIPAK